MVLVAVCASISCDNSTVYNSYRHTAPDGWERSDTLTFDVSPVSQSGDYMEMLGVRLNGQYPFMQLCLVVEQTVLPTRMVRTDTVICNVTTQNGTPRGHGVNFYQHLIPIGGIRLAEGDSLHVSVRHHMRRELLNGISDIGIKLVKQAPSSR